MKTRSVSIRGHRTSLSLEDRFWEELARIAQLRGKSVAGLIAEIDNSRSGGLSSAIRLFVLDTLKQEVAACRTKSSSLD